MYVKPFLILFFIYTGLTQMYSQTPSNQTPFQFGNFVAIGSGTVILTSSPLTRSKTGSIIFAPSNQGTISLATFTISSNGNSTINTLTINPITISGPGGNMTINNFIISPAPPISLNNSNKRSVNFTVTQAILNVPSAMTSGTYNGTYQIVINGTAY